MGFAVGEQGADGVSWRGTPEEDKLRESGGRRAALGRKGTGAGRAGNTSELRCLKLFQVILDMTCKLLYLLIFLKIFLFIPFQTLLQFNLRDIL